jgi:hypothetical protein
MKRGTSVKQPCVQPTGDQIIGPDLQEYIREHWETLAAISWKGYTEEGRGTVVIDSDEGIWFPVFMPVQLLESSSNPVAGADIISGYDPTTEVVFSLLYLPPPWPVFVQRSASSTATCA